MSNLNKRGQNTMPNRPTKGQSRSSYMSSCVKGLKAEGKSPAKAAEMCAAVWYANRPSKKKKKR
uniref:Uncharacterized protein n=1 Tax=viral metagenome TaxID=1070528 RepID=A0A6M3JJS0_9ZZZZ